MTAWVRKRAAAPGGGVNTDRRDAYRRMLARGFRPNFCGVAMHHGDPAGHNRPEVYPIDDWRSPRAGREEPASILPDDWRA